MRNRTLLLTAALVMVALPAHAGLFGSKDKAPATPPATTSGYNTGTATPATAAAAPFKPATAQEVQTILRADALTQAAFFSNQADHDPTNIQTGLYLSNALRALGRNGEAADAAHRVLLFAPDNVDLLVAAARAHIADDNAFFAIDPLTHVTELKPKEWLAWSLLGVAYDQVKRPQDAQGAWAHALQLSPNNPSVLTNMAMSKVMNGDLAAAEPLLRTAATQPSATIQVRQDLALVLGLQGKMAEAETLLRRDLPPAQADASLAWLQQAVTARTSTATTAAPVRSWDSVKTAGS